MRHAEVRFAASADPSGADAGGADGDPPLTARGVQQAAALAERAARWKRPTAVLVSPALRARQTAEPLCAVLGVPAEIVPWLAEVRAQGGSTVDAMRAAERIEAEAMAELRARVASGLASVLASSGATPAATPGRWTLANTEARTAWNDARIVLVGHGMAHAVALEWLLGIEGVPWAAHRLQFSHAAFAAVRAFPFAGDWVFGLVRYDETNHLTREIRTF